MQPGTPYIASGRFHPLKTIFSTIAGMAAAIYVSSLYTSFTNIYPFVVWRVIFMGIIIGGLVIMIQKLNEYSHNRNRIASGIAAGLICYTFWASSWTGLMNDGLAHSTFFTALINPLAILAVIPKHIIDLSEDGGGVYFLVFNPFVLSIVYLGEFLIFVFIVYVAAKTSPYCEDCLSAHSYQKMYIADADGFKERLSQDSEYLRFLAEETFYKHQEQDPTIKNKKAILIELYTCKCNEHPLIAATSYAVRSVDKKPAKLELQKKLIDRVYTEKKTADVLLKKFKAL